MSTSIATSVVAPVVFGFRRGTLRRWTWVFWVGLALAMALLGDLPGLFAGLLVLGVRDRMRPPRYGSVVYFPRSGESSSAEATLSRAAPTPCLWLDPQRVVLGAPYRVIYRDELHPADFARLRRLCRGLPA